MGFDAFLGSTLNLPGSALETGPKSGTILDQIRCLFHPFSRRIGASFSIEIDTFFEPFPETFSTFLDQFVYVLQTVFLIGYFERRESTKVSCFRYFLLKYIYIYTRRKDGAKAPSLLDHLELRFPTVDAKAMDFQRRPQMLKPWIFEIDLSC